jgi:hypothetical protein
MAPVQLVTARPHSWFNNWFNNNIERTQRLAGMAPVQLVTATSSSIVAASQKLVEATGWFAYIQQFFSDFSEIGAWDIVVTHALFTLKSLTRLQDLTLGSTIYRAQW